MAVYFSNAFLDFFKDLSKHNSTEWFRENKSRYETNVKFPFEQFMGDLLEEVKKFDSTIFQTPKEAILRINRDIRFSADKSPYKLYVAAIVSAAGKQVKEAPGWYVQFGADKIAIYGGAYMVDKENLRKIRSEISADLKGFRKLVTEKKFVSHFEEIKGDKNKIIPAEFKADAQIEPLMANKNFYYMVEINPKTILEKDLLKTIVNYLKISKPINDFLIRAME